MNVDNGTLSFGTAIDMGGFDAGKEHIINSIESIGSAAEREGQKIQTSMQKIGVAATAYFSLQALHQFASSVVQVRGEIESLEISFETLLGSKDKAEELLSSIREFAVTTPMTMNSLASGAQTLLGFGIEAEKVMSILQQIGDISMGDAQKFKSLTLAFAQASSAGKLAGQDFLQMVNAGFNPLNEMAKTTGKSIKQLKEEMENGQIKTAQLEAAFASATAEGGMFHGMLEKQSHGIQGALSNLQGAWDDMLNSIGENQQAVFVGGVNALTSLINNYEVFLNAILSVAAAYGTYKAALMAVWVVEKARALADNIRLVMMFRKELGLLTAAQQAFNLTAWANPYVLLAAAIVGVCSALYLYSDRTSDAEKAQKALNDEREEFQKSLDDERQKIDDCINTIQSKTATDYAQIKAYEELKKICHEITDAYTREKLAVADLNETTKILNKRQEEQEYQHAVDELNKWKKALDDVKKAGSGWGKLPKESDAIVRTVHSWGLLKDAIPKMQKMIDGYQQQVDDIEDLRKKAEEEAKPLNVRIEAQTEIISDLQEKFDKAKSDLDAAQKAFEASPSFWNRSVVITYQFQYDNLLNQLNNAQTQLDNLNAQKPESYASAFKKAQKAYVDADKLLKKMQKNRAAYTQKEYSDAADALKDAKKAYEALGGTVKSDSTLKNEAKRIKELLEDIKEIRSTYQLKTDEAQLKIFEEGKTKRLKSIEIEKQQTLDAIGKEQKELEKKLREAGQKLTKSDLEAFDARRQAANEYAAFQIRKTEEENALYISELYRNLAEVFENEEQRKISAIKNTYAEQRRTLKQDLAGGNITQAQYNDLSSQVDNAEAKEIENYWLDTYGDYYQKRKALQETWEANLAKIPAKYQAQARKQMMQELSQIDSEHFKDLINWDSVFGSLDKQSIQSLQINLERVKKYFEENKASMDAKEIKEYTDAIKQMEDEIASRNPFAAMHKSIKDASASKTELINALKELSIAQNELNAAEEAYKNAMKKQKDVIDAIESGELAQDCQEQAEAADRLRQATERLATAQQKNAQAENNVIKSRNNLTQSYKSFAQNLTNAGGVIKDVGGKAKNLAQVFSDDLADGIGKGLDFMDEILGAASDVINAISDVGKSAAKGIESTADAAAKGATASAAAGASAISTIEKASVILSVISAAMQVATAIANLFNNDDKKQKEIERLQGRIDQLQWELENEDAIRLQERYGDAVLRVRELYKEAYEEVMNLHRAESQNAIWFQKYAIIRNTQNEIYQKSVEKIADAYAKVDYTANKALGEDKYKNSRKQLENLAEQQLLIQKQIDEENRKKNNDQNKIDNWKREIQEIANEMAEIINEMMEDIIGTTAEDLASELGDAFFDAAAQGEDAMEAWHKKVNEIVKDIIKRMMITQFLEPAIGKIFDKYKKIWFDEKGNFQGINTVKNSANNFANDLNNAGEQFSQIYSALNQGMKDLFFEDTAERQVESRGIATASQESVDENNARLTTIQGHTYSLVQGMSELNATSNQILARVTGIERNTDETNNKLDNINSRIRRIESSVDEIQTKGIRIKV